MIEMFERFQSKKHRSDVRLNKLGKLGKIFSKSLVFLFVISIILLIILVVSLFFPKEYQNKISFSINIIMYLSMFYIMFFAFFLAKKEKEQYKKLEYQMFNMVISGKLKYKKNSLNIFLKPILYFLVPIITYFIIVYIINLNNEDSINYNNVISNVVTIFSGILSLFQLLEEQNNLPKEEIERNNFENNFYISLKKMNKNKSKEKIKSFLLSIRLIYKQLYEYQKNSHFDNRKFIVDNYNFIIKSNLDNDILYNIFINHEMQKATENDFTLLSNAKLIIAKYGAFENLELNDEQIDKILCYPLLSYSGNHNIITYIFQQAKENKDIKKYIEQSLNEYIDYAENEEDPIFYLSLIIYDEKETFPSILNRKLNDIEFSNIHSRNLFILQCIAYSICNTKLYKKYKNTTKNIFLSKTIQFLDNQIDDKLNDINTSELLNNFHYCICESMDKKHNKNNKDNKQNKNENKRNIILTKILLDILKEKQYPISTILLLNEIITIYQENEWNELKNIISECYDTLNKNEKPVKTEYEKIQMYRNNKQNLVYCIDKNKDKLYVPLQYSRTWKMIFKTWKIVLSKLYMKLKTKK